MRKIMTAALFIVLVVLFFSGCAKLETRIDIEPLINHLPDLSISSACWYGGVKDDRYSGVGPCTYVIYGVATIDEKFAHNIEEEYEWTKGDTNRIFDHITRLDTKGYLDKEQNYLYSKDFVEDKANTYNFEALVSFENGTIVFYAEYIDF